MPGPVRRPSLRQPATTAATTNANVDFGLATAARRVVEGSLTVVPQERVVLVYDSDHEELGVAIRQAVVDARAEPLAFRMEDLALRPMASLAAPIRAAMDRAQASALICSFQDGEYAMREDMIALAHDLGLRHAHMVGITRRSMIAGLAADPHRIANVARALLVRLGPKSVIRVRTGAGTDLTVELSAAYRWINSTGLIRAGKKENLPSGEIATCAANVTGVYIADATLGDASGALNRPLDRSPLRLEIAGGVVQQVDSKDVVLARQVRTLMRSVNNLDRIALVSLGTNVGLLAPVGEIFVDQTLPSFHMTVGITFPEQTAATWTSSSWIAFTQTGSDVDIDGTRVMRGGRYLIE